MLITPAPLPDELDRSYMGRVMSLNGFSKEREALECIANWAGLGRDKPSKLELLSRMAHMELPQFVRQHTTMPFRRGITSYHPELEHGSSQNQSMLRYTGTRLSRPGAYLCADCVAADQDFHGVSYWRREHQTPGLFWCAKHRRSLLHVESDAAFNSSPAEHLSTGHEIDPDWVEELLSHSKIQMFLAICGALLETSRPYSVRHLRDVLRERARELGLQTYCRTRRKGPSFLLSDRAYQAFPRRWLATVFPELADKTPGSHMTQMDGVLYMTTAASSVVPYVLACCVLFESCDETLHLLGKAVRPEPVKSDRQRAPDDEVLHQAYTRHGGIYSAISSATAGSTYTVQTRLRQLGLPNLSSTNRMFKKRAIAAFLLDGLSLSDSAAAGGIDPAELESLLRMCGAPLAAALSHMAKPRSGRGAGKVRPVPLTPREAETASGNVSNKLSPRRRRSITQNAMADSQNLAQ